MNIFCVQQGRYQEPFRTGLESEPNCLEPKPLILVLVPMICSKTGQNRTVAALTTISQCPTGSLFLRTYKVCSSIFMSLCPWTQRHQHNSPAYLREPSNTSSPTGRRLVKSGWRQLGRGDDQGHQTFQTPRYICLRFASSLQRTHTTPFQVSVIHSFELQQSLS